MKQLARIREALATEPYSSPWRNGVIAYAWELLDNREDYLQYCIDSGETPQPLSEKMLLNGARDWYDYSYGGCALIGNSEICERLHGVEELKRYRDGERPPNKLETWLDAQAKALKAAARLILKLSKEVQ